MKSSRYGACYREMEGKRSGEGFICKSVIGFRQAGLQSFVMPVVDSIRAYTSGSRQKLHKTRLHTGLRVCLKYT
jgi:hypothetical protein